MSKSNASTPTTADGSHEDMDFLADESSPAPEKKKHTTHVYKLGPLKITKKKEVRPGTEKPKSLPARVVQKMFSCGGDCATACADL